MQEQSSLRSRYKIAAITTIATAYMLSQTGCSLEIKYQPNSSKTQTETNYDSKNGNSKPSKRRSTKQKNISSKIPQTQNNEAINQLEGRLREVEIENAELRGYTQAKQEQLNDQYNQPKERIISVREVVVVNNRPFYHGFPVHFRNGNYFYMDNFGMSIGINTGFSGRGYSDNRSWNTRNPGRTFRDNYHIRNSPGRHRH